MVFYDSQFKGKFLGKEKYFKKEFILKQVDERKGITQDLYERALNGLEYLSQLRNMGFNPIFKGGSAVQLLIPEDIQRLSIDIDLSINSKEKDIILVLEQIYNRFNKNIYKFEKVGEPFPGIILYNLTIPSYFSETPSRIQLDFHLHEPNYTTQQTRIKSFLYESEFDVRTPTINALIGDKLTVLGPETIGKTMTKNPVQIAKQIYDIFVLLNHSTNFKEIFESYYDVYEFEKENRKKPDLTFKEVINDLVDLCKYLSIYNSIPTWLKDNSIRNRCSFLRRGINGLSTFTSRELNLNSLKTRTVSGKIAFLAKLMLNKFEKNKIRRIPMDIFYQNNLNIKNLSNDESKIDEIIKDLAHLEKKERFHLSFREWKKTNPVGLLFWYGHYFPMDFIDLIL